MLPYVWIISGITIVAAVTFRSWLLTTSRYLTGERGAWKYIPFQGVELSGLLILTVFTGLMLLISISAIREFRNITNDLGQVSDSVQMIAGGDNGERARIENGVEWEYLTYSGDQVAVDLIDTFKSTVQTNPERYRQLITQLDNDLATIYMEGNSTESELIWVGKTIQLDGDPYCLTAGIVPSQNRLFRQKLVGPCNLEASYGNLAATGTGKKIVADLTTHSIGDTTQSRWLIVIGSVLLTLLGSMIFSVWGLLTIESLQDGKAERRRWRRNDKLNNADLLIYDGEDAAICASMAELEKVSDITYRVKDWWVSGLGAVIGSMGAVAVFSVANHTIAEPSWLLVTASGAVSTAVGMVVAYLTHSLLWRIELQKRVETKQLREKLIQLNVGSRDWWKALLLRYSDDAELARTGAELIRKSGEMHLKVAVQIEPGLQTARVQLHAPLNNLLDNIAAIIEEKTSETVSQTDDNTVHAV